MMEIEVRRIILDLLSEEFDTNIQIDSEIQEEEANKDIEAYIQKTIEHAVSSDARVLSFEYKSEGTWKKFISPCGKKFLEQEINNKIKNLKLRDFRDTELNE